jgi:benzoate/toluate 1,2-dioxygenase alpha subunit
MNARGGNAYVDDRPAEGVFRVHRDVFSDPELFELEMRNIFGRTWVFLCLESQIARPESYFTTFIGRTPVLVMRTTAGAVAAFANVCPHKGSLLCPTESGTAKYHVCAYHGWAFDSSGRNVDIKDRKAGGYPPAFDQQSHDLIPLARLASYNGLVFGSLSAEVPPLEEHLGDARVFIDMAMNQGPQGMEVVRGRAAYTYRGNWKMQMDNGLDQYHLTSTHASFMDVQAKRRTGAGNADAQQFDWQKRLSQECGMFAFPRGHTLVWMNQAEVEKRLIYPVIDEVRARLGREQADWMLKPRNLLLFPNMQIADQTTLLIRTFRPVAVGLTEMRVHCLAPIGEAPERRAARLRQFEDFFNPTGLATPDDTTCFESLQRGYAAEPLGYLQGYFRGMELVEQGANDTAREVGIHPTESLRGPFATNCETTLHAPYREWARLMGRT